MWVSVRRSFEKGCNLAKLRVPSVAKTTNERFFQKAIDGKAKSLPFFDGIATDCPPMIIEANKSVAKVLLADGIQRTADGFAELRLSVSIGSL